MKMALADAITVPEECNCCSMKHDTLQGPLCGVTGAPTPRCGRPPSCDIRAFVTLRRCGGLRDDDRAALSCEEIALLRNRIARLLADKDVDRGWRREYQKLDDALDRIDAMVARTGIMTQEGQTLHVLHP
jgi:hypothetical protein